MENSKDWELGCLNNPIRYSRVSTAVERLNAELKQLERAGKAASEAGMKLSEYLLKSKVAKSPKGAFLFGGGRFRCSKSLFANFPFGMIGVSGIGLPSTGLVARQAELIEQARKEGKTTIVHNPRSRELEGEVLKLNLPKDRDININRITMGNCEYYEPQEMERWKREDVITINSTKSGFSEKAILKRRAKNKVAKASRKQNKKKR